MLNSIIRFSLYNRLMVLVLSGLLLVAGTIVMLRTEVDIFPDLNAPQVTVMTEAPGLAAEEVERLVTYPIEMAVNGAQNVEDIRSMSTTGFSVVNVRFKESADQLVARQTVAERLNIVSGELPPAAGTPVIGPQSSILGEILIVALWSDTLSLEQLRTIADRHLRPAMLGVEGVSSVAVIGGDEKEYQVLLDPIRMRHHDVSLDEVLAALDNINANSSGGIVNGYGNEYVVKGSVSTVDLNEISSAVVKYDGSVTLSQIATVKEGVHQPKIGAASYCGRAAVILTVTKQPGAGTITLTEKLLTLLDKSKESLPPSLNISTDIFCQSDFIETSISNLGDALFEGAIMVIIVLFFFMMNIRATVVSLLALPLSILITVLLLHVLGMTINTMSLGGIAIAIGSLVDDAIVDVENVYRRLRENRALPQNERRSTIAVVYDASKEVRKPIFNSSLIIVAGFMPMFFLSGVEGRMLVPLGVAFIIALGASTVVALTLTPVLCSFLLGDRGNARLLLKEPRTMQWLKRNYSKALDSALNHKKAWLVSTGLLFAAALILFFTSGRGFLPPFNEGSFTINVSALPGITLEESDHIGRLAEDMILSVPEITTVARKTGRAELDEHSLSTNVSEIEAPYKLNGRSRQAVVDELRSKLSAIPGVNIEIGQPISHRIDAMLSGTEAPLVIKIFGDDLDRLHSIATQVGNRLKTVDGAADVMVEQQINRPEIEIKPKRMLMARFGITASEFNRFVNTALAGTIVSQVYEEGYPRDIIVKFDPSEAADIDRLGTLMIDTPDGKVPLSAVADIISTEGPGSVNRENAARRIIVSANVEGRDLSSVVSDIDNELKTIELPEGYRIDIGGRYESAQRSSRILAITALLAIAVIFMLLYRQFKSLSRSALILINMPLAMIGGVFILRITGAELDIPAIIGFIALIGIATRNGMLLISHYDQLLGEGYTVEQAVKRGSVDRLSAIVMTALTSALALIPLALRGSDPGNEIQSPLAVVILGGLASSTLLNLFVVPILFGFNRRELRSRTIQKNNTSISSNE